MIAIEYTEFKRALIEVKKLIHWYFPDFEGINQFRKELKKLESHQDMILWFDHLSTHI